MRLFGTLGGRIRRIGDSMNGQPKPTRQELLMRKGLEDTRLSNRALGLLCRALTRYGPVFSWAEVQLAGTDTRIDVILGLQELEQRGYLRDFGGWGEFEVVLGESKPPSAK